MHISVLLVTTLIPWSLTGPTTRKDSLRMDIRDPNPPKRQKMSDGKPEQEQSSLRMDIRDPVNLSEEQKKCLYEGGRRTVPGKVIRPSFSEVSSSCGGDLTELSQLTTPNEFLGTRHDLQLITVRGSCAFNKDFADPEVVAEYSDQFICNEHLKELTTQWSSNDFNHFIRISKKPKCSYPDDHHGTTRPFVKHLYSPSSSVTLNEASAVMTLEKLLLPVGLPVCEYHKKELQIKVAKVERQDDLPLRSGNDYHPSSSDTSDMPSSADDDMPSAETVKAFRVFAASAGESRLTGNIPISHLSKQSLRKKTCGARRLIDVFMKVIAKDDHESFTERVMSPAATVWTTKRTSNKYHDLMAVVTEWFYKVPGRRPKEVALALIAKTVPLRELRLFIPGLSERMYYKAQRISLADIKVDQEKYIRCRFNPSMLSHFTEYITNPLNAIQLPFGHQTVTTSDGIKYSVPNSLRLHRASEIVHSYIKSMEARNLGHLVFSKSTLFKILSYCSATQRKASVCVDYYYAESELGFEYINDLIGFLHAKRAASSQWKSEMEVKVKEVRFYYRGDYRMHVREFSRVADHCISHSLSDRSNNKLRRKCDTIPGQSHSHDLKCDRCELGKSVMVELLNTLEEFERDVDKMAASVEQKNLKEEIEDRIAKLHQSVESIEEYKKHQLRASYSYKIREQMVEKSENEAAAVIYDFGQKWLPAKHLEPQSDYFAKRGMSYHVTHVQTKIGGRTAQHYMFHIIDTDQQDSVAVMQLIRHSFEELKKAGLTTLRLRSDNAGCYHSASTIASVYQLAKETGMKVPEYGFSESQAGKSGADRGSGVLKNKARAYVDAGGDATTHAKLFAAVTSGRLMEGASVYLVSTQVQKAPTVKIDKISTFFDFKYEESGIRMWRHKDIGEGIFIPATSFEKTLSSLPSLEVHEKAGHLPGQVGFWKLSPLLAATSCPKEDLPTLLGVVEKKPHHCPEIICSASFDTEEELEAHWLSGAHCTSPMTSTMRDEALRMFSAGLETSLSYRLDIPDIDDAISELAQSESDAEDNEEEGWALKLRKAVTRFTDRAKEYIEKLFDLGIQRKKKIPAEEAEVMMINERQNGERVFDVEERLNARQISSLYSRIAAAREAAGAKKSRGKRSVDDQDDGGEVAEEEEFDENSVFEEAWYLSDEDRMVMKIWEKYAEIFDPSKGMEVFHEEIFKKHNHHREKRHHHRYPPHRALSPHRW